MPPERKPEETLVRLKPGQTVQADGLVVSLHHVDREGRAWFILSRPEGRPAIQPIDKLSTSG